MLLTASVPNQPMAMNRARSITAGIQLAKDRLAASETRAQRLAERIDRLDAADVQARALADTLGILKEFIADQKKAIASLGIRERDALDGYLEQSLDEELNADVLDAARVNEAQAAEAVAPTSPEVLKRVASKRSKRSQHSLAPIAAEA